MLAVADLGQGDVQRSGHLGHVAFLEQPHCEHAMVQLGDLGAQLVDRGLQHGGFPLSLADVRRVGVVAGWFRRRLALLAEALGRLPGLAADQIRGLAADQRVEPGPQTRAILGPGEIDQFRGHRAPNLLEAIVDVGVAHAAGDHEPPDQLVVDAVELLPRLAQHAVGCLAPQQRLQIRLRVLQKRQVGRAEGSVGGHCGFLVVERAYLSRSRLS